MSLINILPPHVADLIAAGEVVERPASVIKELVENSIDAGGRNIRVEIKGGGMRLIRVTDDGCGMSPEDAGVAFLRHATSKLKDEKGLECIESLGFRGEALAAISAVSRIELKTRQHGCNVGTRVYLTAGDIEEMGPVGCPEGTVMSVSDLFYNTPARLKFVKSDKAEGSACVNAALRCALGHPEVSIRMIKDGEEQFFTPGDGQVKSAVYSLLGRETAMSMLECSGESGGVSVSGYVSAPAACRGNRAMQFFFINGRVFKSLAIQAALEQAYKNSLLTGRFPACALYIRLAPGKVDVNVHPAKTEVKFSQEKQVFDAVYFAVSSALASQSRPAEMKLPPPAGGTVRPRADFYKSMSAEKFRQSVIPAGSNTPAAAKAAPVSAAYPRSTPGLPVLSFSQPETEYAHSPMVERPVIPAAAPRPAAGAEEKRPEDAPETRTPVRPEERTDALGEEAAPEIPEYRLVGEAMDTYIIVESGDGLLFIDKHAAHERMIFDRLKKQGRVPMSQSLLIPVTVNVGEEAVELISRSGELLDRAGFEVEPFGGGSVIIRSAPADVQGDEAALLEEICETLSRGGSPGDRLDDILHTIACKAAVKAGYKNDDAERRVIAEKVLSGEVKYCPHGRPVSFLLTRREIEKQFKRIV